MDRKQKAEIAQALDNIVGIVTEISTSLSVILDDVNNIYDQIRDDKN